MAWPHGVQGEGRDQGSFCLNLQPGHRARHRLGLSKCLLAEHLSKRNRLLGPLWEEGGDREGLISVLSPLMRCLYMTTILKKWGFCTPFSSSSGTHPSVHMGPRRQEE